MSEIFNITVIIGNMILGIDEVGRGPWAGPLVIGAVVWPDDIDLDGLTDSKKLTTKKREALSAEIIKLAADYSIGEISATELERIGLSQALRLATRRAVDKIKQPYDKIIIDGTINFLKGTPYSDYVSTLKKADLLVPAVSAASIIAKVKRDNFMFDMAKKYPDYGFATNVGYGTKIHRQAIDKYGVTPLHRLSFAPLAKYRVGETGSSVKTNSAKLTTKQIGDRAENLIADNLTDQGHVVLARNFKTKRCEIDIVSLKNKTIYFTEVKYRKNEDFGGAIRAVDENKKRQMAYAAEIFMNSGKIKSNNLNDYQIELAVGLVSGDYEIKDWFLLKGE